MKKITDILPLMLLVVAGSFHAQNPVFGASGSGWSGDTAAVLFVGSAVEASRPPNIILMMADDMGSGDLSLYNPEAKGRPPFNTPIRTPYLEQMARNGALMTQFYSAAPICAPARRALLTARSPSRLGEWAEAYRERPDGIIAAEDPTIGMWMQEAGYATAVYGKWNIGEIDGVSRPDAHGFDDWLIIDHSTAYFKHVNPNWNCLGREMLFDADGRVTHLRGQYLDEIFIDRAVDFIEDHANEPFFLYLPFGGPHLPLEDPHDPVLRNYYEGADPTTPEGREVYVKMVEFLDAQMGRVFATLEEQGLTDNTLIIFTADNGGHQGGNNWPFRRSKQWLDEGGLRVPMLIQWPGKIPAGLVSDQPSVLMDAAVTVLHAGRASDFVPAGRELDGIDLVPILRGDKEEQERTLGWRRRDWSQDSNYLRQEALRQGDWKLLRTFRHMGRQTWSDEYQDELFNLANDVGEQNDLAAQMPEKLNAMRRAFDEWKRETVELNSDFLIPVADQLGSPDPQRLEAYLKTAPNPRGNHYLPNPAPQDRVLQVLDFSDDLMQGRLMVRGNEERVSDPVINDEVLQIDIRPGSEHPFPFIYMDGNIDTERFRTMKIRMKVSSEMDEPVLRASALVRSEIWVGQDIPFDVVADGEWRNYKVDVSQSSAWASWTIRGRIGLTFPMPRAAPISVQLDWIRLEP